MAFVLVEGLLSEAPLTPPYAKRLEAVSALLATGGLGHKPVCSEEVASPGDLPALFANWVRGRQGRGYGDPFHPGDDLQGQVKPGFALDTANTGYTRRSEDPRAVLSLLMGLTREDGRTQIDSLCGQGARELRALEVQD
jgi:hypothetical protein